MAIKLKGASCDFDVNKIEDIDKAYKLNSIDILNGGCGIEFDDGSRHCFWEVYNPFKLRTRCRQSKADIVFMFLVTVTFAASAVICILRKR